MKTSLAPTAFVTTLVVIALQCIAANSAPAADTAIDISTATATNWTVTAGDVADAAPYRPGTNGSISVTSTGNIAGNFLPGGTMSSFDGFWLATLVFSLPQAATNVSLSYSNFYGDDRVVLMLNGSPIGATGTSATTSNQVYQGQMAFLDGGALQSWAFDGPDGAVSGVVTNGFIIGGTNILQAVVNNTRTGINGYVQTFGDSGDYSSFLIAGAVSYSFSAAKPQLAGIALYAGLEITGTVGADYLVQFTGDLASTNWSTLTNLVLPSSPYLFFDTESISSRPARFYRVINAQ